jgi:hypothetical protein
MHTKDFARTLRAFAEIADFDRSQDLYRLAAFLDQGRNETIVSRLKQSTPSTGYPARLKESLDFIKAGLTSAGASKPSNALGALLTLFAGRPGATLDAFLAEISVSPQMPDLAAPRFKAVNLDLAKRISAKLAAASPDEPSFLRCIAELSTLSELSAATWALIANQYIGNRRIYRDRKAAIDAIRRHFNSVASNNATCANESSCPRS